MIGLLGFMGVQGFRVEGSRVAVCQTYLDIKKPTFVGLLTMISLKKSPLKKGRFLRAQVGTTSSGQST